MAAAVESLESRRLLSTVLYEGFEGNFPADNGWSVATMAGAGWGAVNSSFGGEGTNTGSYKGYCAGIGYNGTSTAPTYPIPLLTYMSRSINLAGLPNATLRFAYKTLSMSAPDLLYVAIDGTNVHTITSGVVAWTQATVDLNAYLGGTHTLEIGFWGNSGSPLDPKEGVYLDDISVTSDEPPTVIDRQPAPSATVVTPTTLIDVTFSEPVKTSGTGSVDATDMVLGGTAYVAGSTTVGTPTNTTGNTWRFPVLGLVSGTLNVTLAPDAHDIDDLAGNPLASVAWNYTVSVQPDVTIGMGTGTWGYPVGTGFHDARTQVIYLATEIGSSGSISSLALNVSQKPGQTLNNFTIRMKQTSISAYSTASWDGSGWTTVYQKNETISTTGWRTFVFSTPFAYSSGSNLLVDFSFNNSTYISGGLVFSTVMTGNRSLTYKTDSTYGDPLTWSGGSPAGTLTATIPNIRLSLLTVPAAPTNVSASDGTYPDKVQVSWTASAATIGYEVWRNTTNTSGTATKITGSDVVGTTYDDYSAASGVAYYYWVKARNTQGASAFSSSDAGRLMTAPAAPTGVVATDGTYTDKVRVSWAGAAGATGYEVWRNTVNDSATAIKITTADVVGTTYDDSTTLTGTAYYYWVKAKNIVGTSGFSAGDSGNRNRTPTAITLTRNSVAENQPSGTFVGVLSGTDPDIGQSTTLTFSLVSGYGDNAQFSIEPTTKQLQTAAVFEYETKNSYSIKVRATDSGNPGLSYDQVFTVDVTYLSVPPWLGDPSHNLPDPGTNPQWGSGFGRCVSADGNLTAIGTPYSDVGTSYSAGSVYVFNSVSGALVATLDNPAPAVGSADWFGYSVAISGNIVVVGAILDDAGATNSGTAYVFDATTGNLLHTLNNPAPRADDSFGKAVSISGSTVVVGAGRPFGSSPEPGIAYVFDAATGNLLQTLSNPTPAVYDNFGDSLAVAGSVVLVGAPGDHSTAGWSGAAYIFDASTGSLLRTLADPSLNSGGSFGNSVALSGSRAVVGATGDGPGAGGAAYVFDWATGSLLRTLNNPAPAVADSFGASVSISGSTVVVGAGNDDAGATNAGSAFIFNAVSGALVYTLSNPAPAVDDWFGNSVAVSGGIAVVAAYNDDDAGMVSSGQVHLFSADTGGLIRTLSNPSEGNDYFGNSVATSNDVMVVGAYGDNTVYILDVISGDLLYTLANPTPAQGDNFGYAVAISGHTVVVGAPGDDAGAGNTGAAYIFDVTTGALLYTLNNPAPADDDGFGRSVAISGSTVVVGAYFDYAGGSRSGAAYVFNADTGSLLKTLINPTPAYDDRFGYAVAISGSTIVVGAAFDDAGAADSGAAYAFDAITGNLLRTISDPFPRTNDWFGRSVAVSGSVAVIGAYGTTSGAAYMIDVATGNLIRVLNDPVRTSNNFGCAVAISGSIVVVGAVYDDAGATNAGAAYIFDATGSLLRKITSPAPAIGGFLGSSVAVSYNAVVVGAPNEDGSSYDSGAYYAFIGLNQAPTDMTMSTGGVSENQPAGTVAAALAGTDANTDETLTYSLVAGDGSTDNSSFYIVGDQLLAGASFDFETKSSYSIRVRTTDAGGLSFEKNFTIWVVNVVEWAPAITWMSNDTGLSDVDRITSDNTLVLTGNSEPGMTIDVYVDGGLIGTTTAGGGGWYFDYSGTVMADGVHGFTAIAKDTLGNAIASSATYAVTIDTLAPATPAAPDLRADSDSGVSAFDNITNDATPTFNVPPNEYFRFYRDGMLLSGDYRSGTSYTPAAQPDGTYSYTVALVDAAGNVSAFSAALWVTIDTVSPASPGTPDLQAASDSGLSSTDDVTNVKNPFFDVAVDEPGTLTLIMDGDASRGYPAPVNSPGTTSILLPGNGFEPAVSYPSTNSMVITMLDVDLDGYLDIVQGGVGVNVLWGRGNGAFGPMSTFGFGWVVDRLVTGDVNGDGFTDVVAPCDNYSSNFIGVFLGDATGFSLHQLPITSVSLTDLALADVDRDGNLDLVISRADSSFLEMMYGNGDGSFQPASAIYLGAYAYGRRVVAADFTGDAKLDLLVTTTDGRFLALLGAKSGGFSAPTGVSYAEPGEEFVVADLNGDGNLDVATSGGRVLLGMGDGLFADGPTIADPGDSTAIATDDLNGDSIVDLVFAPMFPGDELSVVLGNGDGTFAMATRLAVPSRPGAIAVADLNGDGRADLVSVTGSDSTTSVMLADKNAPMIADGTHEISAYFSDLAGNTSPVGLGLSVTFDATAPTTPLIPFLQDASDSGLSHNDDRTNILTPTFDVDAGPYYRFYRDGSLISSDYTSGTTYTLPLQSEGAYSYTVVSVDAAGNESCVSPARPVVFDTTAPTVQSSAVNGGAVQRSKVTGASFTFSEAVAADGQVVLRRRGGLAVSGAWAVLSNPSGDGRTFTVTFAGDALIGGSLPDAMYELLVSGDLIDVAGNALGLPFVSRFHRLFGDADGDRDVDAADLSEFKKALNRPAAYNGIFDYDGDGTVDAADYLQLKLRRSKSVLY